MRIKDLLVVSACDAFRKPWGELWVEHIRRLPVEWQVFDLGGFGQGEVWNQDLIVSPADSRGLQVPGCQADMILHVLRQRRRPILWLDTDAFIVHPLHDVLASVDLAVTVVPQSDRPAAGTIDAGVFFAYPTARAEEFVEQWGRTSRQLGADQPALSRLVSQVQGAGGKLIAPGASIRMLPGSTYNQDYFATMQVENAKIVRFKRRGPLATDVRTACEVAREAINLPPAPDAGLRLRIGQRGRGRDGWVHLDSHESADIVAAIPPLPESIASRQWRVVEAIHVWEHFYKWEAEQLAKGVYEILAPGGRLILECPNLEVACRSFLGEYKDSPSYHMHVFYGDPGAKDPSYGHRWGYTPESLKRQLVEHGGFRPQDVTIEPAKHHVPDRDFRIVACKR